MLQAGCDDANRCERRQAYINRRSAAGLHSATDVIRGLRPRWLWRVGLVLLDMGSYYASMLVVASKLKYFHGKNAEPRRLLRRLCWNPYFTAAVLAKPAG